MQNTQFQDSIFARSDENLAASNSQKSSASQKSSHSNGLHNRAFSRIVCSYKHIDDRKLPIPEIRED